MNINEYGFVRVAAASPKLRVADCSYNISQIKEVIEDAVEKNVQLLCFPELAITGYTCGDLFFQSILQSKATDSLFELVDFMYDKTKLIIIVGLPLAHNNRLYNVAAVISWEGIMGFVPKQELATKGDLNEQKWFSSGAKLHDDVVDISYRTYPFSSELIFETNCSKFGIEIGKDLWALSPPSISLSQKGADIIFNLSAMGEVVGKNKYQQSLITNQSAHTTSAYVCASAGVGESTTDAVFSGSCFIAENGKMLAQSKRFSLDNELIVKDIDLSALRAERIKTGRETTTYQSHHAPIFCYTKTFKSDKLLRTFSPHPFIPALSDEDEHYSDIYNIQTHGLAKRLLHTHSNDLTVGISGGLDSTLALLVAIKTFDVLNIPRKNIHAITMPGFGTTDRTYKNALSLMSSCGVTTKEISIVPAVTQHLKDIGHDINDQSVTFENSQARERTQILMDYANKTNSLVLGTGNLSELALGWATYNGDHMSMYAVNAGVPKTLVASLVRWIANNHLSETTKEILLDILNTPFSPELLPADNEGKIVQKTEGSVGPYELHDFFIHRILRYNDAPKRVYFIAQQAFKDIYASEEILKWLKVFYHRFFSQQFKRSCLPDGPTIGSVNLSPRGSWQMPSDAMANLWINELNEI